MPRKPCFLGSPLPFTAAPFRPRTPPRFLPLSLRGPLELLSTPWDPCVCLDGHVLPQTGGKPYWTTWQCHGCATLLPGPGKSSVFESSLNRRPPPCSLMDRAGSPVGECVVAWYYLFGSPQRQVALDNIPLRLRSRPTSIQEVTTRSWL